jgi:hypothetical protein
MLETLESHTASNFHFLRTGDGSGMFDEYHHETTWAASRVEVDKFERPTHYHRKTMVATSFNNTGESFLNFLP